MPNKTSEEELRILSGVIGGGMLGAAIAGSGGAVLGAIIGAAIVEATKK